MSQLALTPVDRVSNINSKEFKESYFKPLRPLIIEDMAKSWPALEKWTPDFFKTEHGDKQVKVYDDNFVVPGKKYMSVARTIPLSEYIDQVTNTSQNLRMFLYNIKSEIPEMVDDIIFPDLVDDLSKKFVFMFFGCKGSVTQMHFDIDMSHVFHTAISGKKTITLFPFEQGKQLHRYPFTCRSYVDVHNPDFEQYPGLKDVKGFQVTMEPGETLFIPSGYWHHLVYDEACLAISLRCANSTLMGKVQGAYNLLVMQMVDRVMNRVFSDSWFNWKKQRALQI